MHYKDPQNRAAAQTSRHPKLGEQGLPQIPKTDLPGYKKLQSPWGTGWPGRKPCKLFWSLLYALKT